MKASFKIIAALFCLQIIAISAFAQTNKKAFTGIWELAQAGAEGQELQTAPVGYLKTFNADNTFANLQIRQTGTLITHSGNFKVVDEENYTETALYRIPEMGGGPLGTAFKLQYKFSDDKKLITIKYTVESGATYTEVWRRL